MATNDQRRILIDQIPLDSYPAPQAQDTRGGESLIARLMGAGQSNTAAAPSSRRALIDAAFDGAVDKATAPAVPGALRDVAGRGLAAFAGAPVDVAAMALAPAGYSHAAPVGGSEWIGKQMEQVGAISPERRPAAELLANLATPAALPKAAATAGLAFMAAMSPEGKARLLADLTAGKGSGTYRLGDVTEGQAKGLNKLFGRDGASRDVMMTDAATDHLLAGRVNKDGFAPAEVAGFAEAAMARGAKPDLNVAKQNQHPSLLGLSKQDSISGRQYQPRMPMDQGPDGYVVRSVVPEGLPTRNKKPPRE